MRAGPCFLQAVGVLVLFTIARALGLVGPPRYVYVPVSLLVVALVLIAWRNGATRADLGLDRSAVAGASASVGGQVLVVLGAVAVTFVAGLVFCWLRLRSRSLIAPVMAHVATNGLALTVAWFTVHRGSLR
jgi:membrane protease YdiL (CAAX protease family)